MICSSTTAIFTTRAVTACSMGLLDQPLISEMDAIEKSARRGDAKALETIYATLPKMKQMYIDRQVRAGHTLREAFGRAGIVICIR